MSIHKLAVWKTGESFGFLSFSFSQAHRDKIGKNIHGIQVACSLYHWWDGSEEAVIFLITEQLVLKQYF
jgi:hypothetical protein